MSIKFRYSSKLRLKCTPTNYLISNCQIIENSIFKIKKKLHLIQLFPPVRNPFHRTIALSEFLNKLDEGWWNTYFRIGYAFCFYILLMSQRRFECLFGRRMTCGDQMMNKSASYPSQRRLAPIYRPPES